MTCFRERKPSLSTEQPAHALPFRAYVAEGQFVSPNPANDDKVDPLRDPRRPRAKTLSAEPLHAVSHHGSTELLGRNDAKPSRPSSSCIDRYEKNEVTGGDAFAAILSTNEIATLSKAPDARKGRSRRRRPRGRARDCGGHIRASHDRRTLLLENLYREARTPLAPTVRQHLSTATRLHAGAEAVGADAANLVGLVGAFHGKVLGFLTGARR